MPFHIALVGSGDVLFMHVDHDHATTDAFEEMDIRCMPTIAMLAPGDETPKWMVGATIKEIKDTLNELTSAGEEQRTSPPNAKRC